MRVHSYGEDTASQPDTSTMIEMDQPEAQRELLSKYGYEALAARAERVPISTRYPAMGDDEDIFKRYFSVVPERDTFKVPIDDLLADMANANNAVNSKGGKLFDDLVIWTTPDNSALLLVGVVGEGADKEYFLVAQANGLDQKITATEMRKHFEVEDRQSAQQQKRANRKTTVRNYALELAAVSDAICGVLLIVALSVVVFWLNDNWWLFATGVGGIALAIFGFARASLDTTRFNVSGLVAGCLACVCLLMMACYGLANIDIENPPHTITQKTILVCAVDNNDSGDRDSNLTTADQTYYDIVPGAYYVTRDLASNSFTLVHEPTSLKAATVFRVGHAYRVTIDNKAGWSLSGITTAREVPNTMGECG